MKRFSFYLLLISMVLSLVLPVSGETISLSGTFSDTVTWSLEKNVLTISGTGPVQSNIGYPWSQTTDSRIMDNTHKIIVEEGITEIGRNCFISFGNATEIQLPNSLKTIGYSALALTSIKELSIPKNVESIDPSAFNSVAENIWVDDENEHFYDIDGILFCSDTHTLVEVPPKKPMETYVVPEGIKIIGQAAFAQSSLTEIVLPKGLEVIEGAAFSMSKLKGVTIPDTVTAIGEAAFYNCDGLETIIIPARVSTIKDRTFQHCDNLSRVTILNPNCDMYAESSEFFPEDAVLCGYQNSTIQKYSAKYGRCFCDVETGEEVDYFVEGGLPAMLPTDLIASNPVECSTKSYVVATGEVTGYQPHVPVVTDTSHPTYQDIYATTMEITKDCVTNEERVRAVINWVYTNFEYASAVPGGSYTLENVYSIWNGQRYGNCMLFTKIANFMLNILGFPTAYCAGANHAWPAVLVDGKWVQVDATSGNYGNMTGLLYSIDHIFFCVGPVVLVIDDFSGIKMASYGCSITDTVTANEIYIPDYVTFIYENTFSVRRYTENQPRVTIRGEIGSYAENYVRENFADYSIIYEGSQFIARAHQHSIGEYCTNSNYHWRECSGCNESFNLSAHKYDGCTDAVCDTCGYTREVTHTFRNEWSSDDNNHWHTCEKCSATTGPVAHTWDSGTIDKEHIHYSCVVCKQKKTEVYASPNPTEPNPTEPSTEPIVTESTESSTDPSIWPNATESTMSATDPINPTTTPTDQSIPADSQPSAWIDNDYDSTNSTTDINDTKPFLVVGIIVAVVAIGGVSVLLVRKKRK